MVEIVPKKSKNTDAEEQESGITHEVSSDSNGMFQQLTKEERDNAERKLNGRKVHPCVVPVQEQHNVPIEYHTENALPQNINQQMQPTVVPQNAVVQENQNQNGMVNPRFHQQGEQKEKHRHQYSPMPFDDAIGCVTYVVKVHVNADDRIAMDKYNTLSRVLRSERKADTIDIAYMYIKNAKDYTTKIQLDIDYINANNVRQNKSVFVDKEDCINNCLVDALRENGICCFDTDISKKKISEYLYKIVLSKLCCEVYELPEDSGFHKLNGRYCFVTKEYCEKNNYPIVTDKTFDVNLESGLNSETAEQSFLRLAKNHNSAEQFLLLNVIRITGLLSNPLYYCGFKLNRIVFIKGGQ